MLESIEHTYILYTNTPAVPGDVDKNVYTMTVSGRRGSTDLMAVFDTDCNEGEETLTCRMFTVPGLQLGGKWTVTVAGKCAMTMHVTACDMNHISTSEGSLWGSLE